MSKTNLGLVEHAEKWVGQVYWYGTYCQPCTESRLNAKKKQYPSHYTSGRMATYKKHIQQGKKCTDCVGLIKGYCWDGTDGDPGYAINGCPDVSANGMYRAAKVKGSIKTLPETPGLLLWRDGHIGVYVGGGYAVEARGFNYGVVKTRVKDRTWTNWCECPYIEYQGGTDVPKDTVLGDRILKKGMKGSDVKTLQEKLMELGYKLPKYGADGEYGGETVEAVKAFQKASGLSVDGQFGPKSLEALMDALAGTGPSGGDAPEEEDKPVASGEVTITGGTVNLRLGPGTQYERVAIARKGDRLDKARTEGWIPVILGGKVVWVSSKYAKVGG